MEPSEEIRQVVTRLVEALRDGDGEAVSDRVSRVSGFERFGSAAAEWWQDGGAAAQLWIQQMQEMGGGYRWELKEPVHALSEGSVGWAGARTEFRTPQGSVEMRFTCVLHLEHSEWKLVQWHSSIPSPNEELGFFLTESVDGIAREVSESRPDLSAASSPDGTVTIAFTDIEGSVRLNAVLGDRRWNVLHAHNAVIDRASAEHGGTVVKSQGDGTMLAFASSRRALTCALAIQDAVEETFNDPGSMIRVRIGLHVGEVVHEADDFFGHAVNYAARIAAAAAGGEILVSALVHDLLAQTGEFGFDEIREVDLKGLEGSQTVYRVAASATQQPSAGAAVAGAAPAPTD